MTLVGSDFKLRHGQRPGRADLEIAVAGYVIYFKSKGVLS